MPDGKCGLRKPLRAHPALMGSRQVEHQDLRAVRARRRSFAVDLDCSADHLDPAFAAPLERLRDGVTEAQPLLGFGGLR
jgi:hypothetical protein